MGKKLLLILVVFLTVSSCTPLSPFTSAPGYTLMAYDYINKRKRLTEYAENGDVYSQYQLGMEYCCGNQTWNDNKQAMKWLCTAAKNGYSKAQFELGKIYENKDERSAENAPVKTDLARAYIWYAVAADLYMNYEAVQAKKDLEDKLSPAEIKKVRSGAKNWRSLPCG